MPLGIFLFLLMGGKLFKQSEWYSLFCIVVIFIPFVAYLLDILGWFATVSIFMLTIPSDFSSVTATALLLRFSSYPESMQMSTNSSFKYPWKLVFFNSSGISLSVPRWSTSLPCLLESQDLPPQCLLSLPWWVRHPLPPTNMRAMNTLLDVKPT